MNLHWGWLPKLVKEVFDIIRNIHAEGTTILLIEQNAMAALEVADYGYVLQTGQNLHGGERERFAEGPLCQRGLSRRVSEISVPHSFFIIH